MSGTIWVGRSFASARSRAPTDRARFSSRKICRRSSFSPSGASLVVSTPPATPESSCPSAILFATWKTACSPVPHACCTSLAGVSGDSREPSTLSRARLKSRLCLSTAPAATSPSRSSCRPNRLTRPSSAAVNMSWLLAVA